MRARRPATPSPRSPRPSPPAPLCRAVFFSALAFLRPPLVRYFALARRKLRRQLFLRNTRRGLHSYDDGELIHINRERMMMKGTLLWLRLEKSRVYHAVPPENFQSFQSSSA